VTARRLDGRRVAVTRAPGGGDALAARLRALGAEVLEFPAIAAAAPESFDDLDAALRRLPRFDWAAFASATAVERVLLRMGELGLAPPALAMLQLAAVGPATAAALARRCRAPDLVATDPTGAGLAAALGPHVRGRSVLAPRAAEGRPELVAGLEAAGAEVAAPVAYRTVPAPPETLAALGDLLEAGGVDAVAFASPSAARSVAAALGARAHLLRRAALAALGPTTAEALRGLGWVVAAQADRPGAEALAEAIAEALGRR
jgi:uroporphyrinogen-III synthase/uroporphyrinogen III methyltransferase/synthase